jgi:hypothetical protein
MLQCLGSQLWRWFNGNPMQQILQFILKDWKAIEGITTVFTSYTPCWTQLLVTWLNDRLHNFQNNSDSEITVYKIHHYISLQIFWKHVATVTIFLYYFSLLKIMDKQRLQNYGLSLTSTQSVQHSNMTKLKVQISAESSEWQVWRWKSSGKLCCVV